MKWPALLSTSAITFLSLLGCAVLSVHSTSYTACDRTLMNSTCIQNCNGSSTCNYTCPTQQGYKECFQQCSIDDGCVGNYQCQVPNFCRQECYDGHCYCNTRNCTQACSARYCRNTGMTCHSENCRQTCAGDCNLKCTKNATGVCEQDCIGSCKNTICDQKRCTQKAYCRNSPCILQCSSNVDDCRQTCLRGKCVFKCNAKKCTAKCNSGICEYKGNPLVNTNNQCDKIDTLSKQCFQEGCGWPNCSINCANGLPGLVTGCSQSCMEPLSPCPKSMACSYEDCMQNCFGSCKSLICDRKSDRCGQLCEGNCDLLHCNATTHCIQHCGGDCSTIECSSVACLQSCKSENCTIRCNDKVANCSQTCSTVGTRHSCVMESKALTVEHQTCKKNCISMTCGKNSINCTQTCGEGCTRMVCSSTFCDQNCTNGGCILECTSSVRYCKQTCRSGNCTAECHAQECVKDFGNSPTTTKFTTTHVPTTLSTETTSQAEQPSKPTTTAIACPLGETNAQRKIESLIQNRDDHLVLLLCIAIGILSFLVLVIFVGFICVLRRLQQLAQTREPQMCDNEGNTMRGFDNTAF